jgi:hypothetical protein
MNLLRFHGTRRRYQSGCSCPMCRSAHARYNQDWRKEHPEKTSDINRKAGKRWRERNPGWAAKAALLYRRRHPTETKARRDANNALSSGRIARLPCEVCGTLNTEKHHDDYTRPLDVVWLCPEHHRQLTLKGSEFRRQK